MLKIVSTVKLIKDLDLDQDINVNENLNNYLSSLPGSEQKSWYATELYYRKKL